MFEDISEAGQIDDVSSSSSKRARNNTKNTRTLNACDGCKRRRTKCSGLPGPCSACSQNGTYCHFHPRMDSRRKDCMKSQDASKMRRNILSGLLLALRMNSDANVQELLRVIRTPKLSAIDLAQSIRRQLETVSVTCGSPALQLTEDDILSLGLADMLHNKAYTLISVQEDGAYKRMEPTRGWSLQEDGAYGIETFEPAVMKSVARPDLLYASVPSVDCYGHKALKNQLKPTLLVENGDLQAIQTRGSDSRSSLSPISASLSVAASQLTDLSSYVSSPIWDNQDDCLMNGSTDELVSEVGRDMIGAGQLSMISQDHNHLPFSWLPACRSH